MDDGTDTVGDIEFDGGKTAECCACNTGRLWKEFDDLDSIPMKKYTVIGIYADGGGRYATCVEARNPHDAEEEAKKVCREDNSKDVGIDLTVDIGQELLDIAAVIEGDNVKIVA